MKLFHVYISIIIGVVLFCWQSDELKDFKPEDAGVGFNTVVKRAKLNGFQINSVWLDHQNLIKTAKYYHSEGKKIVLFLGASQLNSINQPEEESKLMIEYLNELNQNDSIVFLQASIPDATYHELYFVREYLRENNIPIYCTCVSLCFDDLRERPIKPEFFQFLEENLTALNKGNFVKDEVYNQIEEKKKKAKDNPKTPNIIIEEEIVENLEEVSSLYKNRNKVIAKNKINFGNYLSESIILLSGMKLRSSLTGELATPKIQAKDSTWNVKAINTFFEEAHTKGERLFFYYQPLRPHSSVFPYDSTQFINFKSYLTGKCDSNKNFGFTDLTPIIPQEFWGKTDLGYPDIFHFQEKGHKILADSLKCKLQKFLPDAI